MLSCACSCGPDTNGNNENIIEIKFTDHGCSAICRSSPGNPPPQTCSARCLSAAAGR
jgi:hypothetical protein